MDTSLHRMSTRSAKTAVLAAIVAGGCQPVDAQSLLIPRLLISEA